MILVEVYRRDPSWAEPLRRLPAVAAALIDARLVARLTTPPF